MSGPWVPGVVGAVEDVGPSEGREGEFGIADRNILARGISLYQRHLSNRH